MRRFARMLALGASVLVLFGACTMGGGGSTIKIGSDGFDEARVVAEIYAQALEANGFKVDRAGIGLGTRKVTATALESGQIDLKPEYLGSALAFYGGTKSGDAAAERDALQAILAGKGGGITALDYAPAQDQNAFVVRRDTADKFALTQVSQLAPIQDQLKWGLATDCPTNPVCAAALKSAYGIAPKDVTLLDACSTPMADALKAGTIDVAELCSTGPEIIVNGWVRLEDDKATQGAENVLPLVRNDLLAKVDKTKLETVLNAVSAKLDTQSLAALYKQVAVDKMDIKDVAAAWLKATGFVK